MKFRVLEDKQLMGRTAAAHAAKSIRAAMHDKVRAGIVAATGVSQVEFLDALTGTPDIDWSRIKLFHLDEYVGRNQSPGACIGLRWHPNTTIYPNKDSDSLLSPGVAVATQID